MIVAKKRSERQELVPRSSDKQGKLASLVGYFSGGEEGIGARVTKAYELMMKGYDIVVQGYQVILKGREELGRFYFDSARELAQAYRTLEARAQG